MRKFNSTVYDFLILLIFAAVAGMSTYAAWQGRSYVGVGLLAVVDSLLLGGIVSILSHGLRAPTTFERLEGRADLRGFTIFIGGGVIFFIGTNWGPFQKSWVMFVFVVVWLVASGLALRKIRGRHESLAAYKRRMNYQKPPETPTSSIQKRP